MVIVPVAAEFSSASTGPNSVRPPLNHLNLLLRKHIAANYPHTYTHLRDKPLNRGDQM